MLTTIKEILFGIWDFIVGIFDFVAGIFRDLAAVARFLVHGFAAIPSYLGWFPASFAALLVVGVSIAVIYKIAGREG